LFLTGNDTIATGTLTQQLISRPALWWM